MEGGVEHGGQGGEGIGRGPAKVDALQSSAVHAVQHQQLVAHGHRWRAAFGEAEIEEDGRSAFGLDNTGQSEELPIIFPAEERDGRAIHDEGGYCLARRYPGEGKKAGQKTREPASRFPCSSIPVAEATRR